MKNNNNIDLYIIINNKYILQIILLINYNINK